MTLCGGLFCFTIQSLSIQGPLVQAHNKLWFFLIGFLSFSHTQAGTRLSATHHASHPSAASPGGISRQRCWWTVHGSDMSYGGMQQKHPNLQGYEAPRRTSRGRLLPSRCYRNWRDSWSIRNLFSPANKHAGSCDAGIVSSLNTRI